MSSSISGSSGQQAQQGPPRFKYVQNRYFIDINENLGAGTFGSIYKAYDIQQPNKLLAVKALEINSSTSQQRPQLQQITTEVQGLVLFKEVASFYQDHPYICLMHDEVLTKNNQYVFMEQYPKNLKRFLAERDKEGKYLTEGECIDILSQMAKILTQLHTFGIFHRDIKSTNILIKNGICKLIDPGVAIFMDLKKILQKSKEMKDIKLNTVGAESFIAPENKELKLTNLQGKSDTYSLGITFYELLFGSLIMNNEIKLYNQFFKDKYKEISNNELNFSQKYIPNQNQAKQILKTELSRNNSSIANISNEQWNMITQKYQN